MVKSILPVGVKHNQLPSLSLPDSSLDTEEVVN